MSRAGCIREGCTAKATVAPRLNVPAQGWPIDMHRPMTAIVGMPLCEEHFKDVANLEGLKAALGNEIKGGDDLMGLIQATLLAAGKLPPDFDRAWVTRLSINSEEYKSFASRVAR